MEKLVTYLKKTDEFITQYRNNAEALRCMRRDLLTARQNCKTFEGKMLIGCNIQSIDDLLNKLEAR